MAIRERAFAAANARFPFQSFLGVTASLLAIRLQRENGYINQAMPTPIAKNKTSESSAYLNRAGTVPRASAASATETHAANAAIAAKWLT